MKQDHFKHTVLDVFQSFTKIFFDYSPVCKVASRTKKHEKRFDNIIFITILGDIEGGFTLEIDNETVHGLLCKINQVRLEKQMDMDILIKSYIGEFANILVSKIIANLGRKFGNTLLSSPSLFSGMRIDATLFYDETYTAYIICEVGVLKISISIKN